MKLTKVILTLIGAAAPVALLIYKDQLDARHIIIAALLYSLAYALHLTAHELGHLIGGKISGYTLLSLGLGPVSICRTAEGKLSLEWERTLSGQCIMIPKMSDGVPFFMYNLSGAVSNIVLTALGFVLLISDSIYASLLFVTVFFIGLQKIIINLIPHKTGGIPNDGYVVRLLSRDREAVRDYAVYLNLYAKLSLGEPIAPADYTYERAPGDADAMMYYNEIREILRETVDL